MSLIGAIRVVMGLETAQYESRLTRTRNKTNTETNAIARNYARLRSSVASDLRKMAIAVGSFALASSAFQNARGAVEWASGLSEAAAKIGVTVQQLQILRLYADQNGASMQTLERAIAFLNRTLGQAKAGLPSAVAAFRSIGITPEQLVNLRNAGDAFPLVAEGISRFGTEAEQAAAAQQFMGRASAELLPILAQGRAGYDEATQAAIRNGLVTDEQARKADEAADAFGMMAASLRVQLLDAIGDALPGLITLANVLGTVMSAVISLLGWIGQLAAGIASLFEARPLDMTSHVRQFVLSHSPNAAPWSAYMGTGWTAAPDTPDPRLRLGGGGGNRGGGGGGANAERRQHQVATELRRAEIDELRAKQDLARTAAERHGLAAQISVLEQDQQRADREESVRSRERSREEADQLGLIQDRTAGLRRAAADDEVLAQLREEEREAAEQRFEIESAAMRAEADAATTASERRRIELDLLDLTYEHRRAKLEAIAADQAVSEAQRRAAAVELASLPAAREADTARVMRDTRGPLESFIANIPQTAREINESLQSIAVEGVGGLTRSLAQSLVGLRSLSDGFKALKNIALNALSSIVEMMLQRGLMSALSRLLPGMSGSGGLGGLLAGGRGSVSAASSLSSMHEGLHGFDAGGSFQFGGMAGIDRNVLSFNGQAIARVSKGETGIIAPQGARGRGGGNVEVNIYADRALVANDIEEMVREGMSIAAQQGAIGGAALAQAQIRKRAGRRLGR